MPVAVLVISDKCWWWWKSAKGRSYRAVLDAVFAVFAASHLHHRQDVDEVPLCLHPSSKGVLRFILLYAIRYIPGVYSV